MILTVSTGFSIGQEYEMSPNFPYSSMLRLQHLGSVYKLVCLRDLYEH